MLGYWGGGWGGGLFGVEALEFGVAVKDGEIRIAARPDGILGTRFPSFAQGIQGFRLFFQAAVDAGRVVEDRSFVRAQGDGQIEFAQSVFLAIQSA